VSVSHDGLATITLQSWRIPTYAVLPPEAKHSSRIAEAKKRLNAFRPSSLSERKAAQDLREFLTPVRSKRQRGRPRRITAEDRRSMRRDALQLTQEGKTTDEIVRVLSQRYELRATYTKRILEDASDSD